MSGFMMKAINGLVNLNRKDRFTPDLLYAGDTEESAIGAPISIVALPGHTLGSIGIVVNEKECACGDFLINLKKPQKGLGIIDTDEFSRNLEKLRDRGIEIIYPGHGKSFLLRDFKID
jgi:glyoxylase-like metal-dependent hydrolase (beta-lactamase superfamily II)